MNKEEILEALNLLEEVANENELNISIADAIDMLQTCDTLEECRGWVIENVQ